MGNLTPRPVPQAKMKPLTDEEKQQRIMQFLSQKREAFSINILSAIAHGADTDWSGVEIKNAVDLSVKMADALMEKLYPIKEDNNGKQD